MNEEQKIIRTYFTPIANNEEALNLRNDAALLLKQKKMVITTDMMIEGVHFDKTYNPEILSRKLLRVNLSDLAAIGCFSLWLYLKCCYSKKIEKGGLKNLLMDSS